jgi:hypothetical protein
MSTRIRVGIGHDCSLLVLLETYGLPPFHTSGRVENMITVGHRRERPMAGQGDGILLAEGARFSETIALLAKSTFIPKGVYRFRSHMEANTQQADCLAKGMGRLAAERV